MSLSKPLLSCVIACILASSVLYAKEKTVEKTHFSVENTAPFWCDFYGSITGAETGDEVGVYDKDGVLCGAGKVKKGGIYGFIHIYLDIKATEVDEGAVAGESLTFILWKHKTDEQVPLVAAPDQKAKPEINTSLKPVRLNLKVAE